MSVKIKKENIKNTLAFTNEIVEKFPKRLVGTPDCDNAGIRIEEEFKKNCDPGTVKRVPFSLNPRSFMKYFRPAVGMYGAALLAVFLKKPVIALGILGSVLSVFVSQFMFYKKIFDPFFPKATGYNVYGTIEPEGEVKQQIILSGHHDSAYVFHYLELSPRFYPLFIIVPLVFFFLAIIFASIMTIARRNPVWMKKVLSVGLAGVMPLWWFTTDKVSPGAGDNMIAVAAANEATKIFADLKKQGRNALKHTRIICLSVDGEESGLRGAMAFVKANLDVLKKTKTYVFNMDTLYNADKLVFFDNDLNLTVDLSKEMANECKDIATSLGYKAKVSKMPWGGGSTDAAAFGQKGIEATNLIAMELDPRKLEGDMVYHTSNDKTKYIEPEVVEQTLNIIKEYILRKDRQVS
jgi:aminopeptidase YwaD